MTGWQRTNLTTQVAIEEQRYRFFMIIANLLSTRLMIILQFEPNWGDWQKAAIEISKKLVSKTTQT